MTAMEPDDQNRPAADQALIPTAGQGPLCAPYQALVIGAHGAIGSAFVSALSSDPACRLVQTVSRSSPGGFDLLDAESIRRQAQRCASDGLFDLIVDATGALTISGAGPEKSLRALDSAILTRSMQINAIGPMLVLQHFAPLLATGPAIYAKLSARVGSISDNRKGGWYGYRASKAALNMMLQTAAIELQRRKPLLRVVALQPGTVRSTLSAPFQAGVPELLEPGQSVAGMMRALRDLPVKSGAHFIDYKGQEIPW